MVHELGRVISPSLNNSMDESEDFADQFAQAFLFPEELAQKVYNEIIRHANTGKKISIILSYARDYEISPITIYKAINSYAEHHGKQTLNLGNGFFGATTNFNKKHKNVSELLCGKEPITAKKYITSSEKAFKTPFFKILKKYLSETEKPAGFVQTILGANLLDAKEIHADLIQ